MRAIGVMGVWLSLLSLLGGCLAGGDGDGDGGRLIVGCVPRLEVCDIATADCQASVFAATACVRGQMGGALPPVRTIDSATLRQELNASAEEMMIEPGPWDTALQLLGLLPQLQTGVDAQVDDLVTGVAAFYSSETQSITIIEDAVAEYGDEVSTIVLSHELVHALQDRAQGLDSLRERFGGSTDGATALTHAVEGEAVALSAVVSAHAQYGGDSGLDWDSYFDDMQDGILGAIEDSPAPFVTALQSLAYPLGGRVMHRLRQDGGQAQLEQIYIDGPGATVDWLGGDPIAGHGSLVEMHDCLPEAPAGDRVVAGIDSFGADGLVGMLVSAGLSGDEALALAAGLRADAVVVSAAADGERDVAVEMRLQFSAASTATQVGEAIADGLSDLKVETDGAAVRISGAEQDAVLLAVAAQNGCGSEAQLVAAIHASLAGQALRLPHPPHRGLHAPPGL